VKYRGKHAARIFFFNTANMKVEEIRTSSCYDKKIKPIDDRLYIWNGTEEHCREVKILENRLEKTLTSLTEPDRRGIVLETL